MTLILGHTNTDLDCLGSMVLARYLYPEAILIRSGRIHPVARNLHNLYKNHLKMLPASDFRDSPPDRIVIVDTRTKGRVKEFFSVLGEPECPVEIWDHHPADQQDIENAVIHEGRYGANTTQLALELMKRKIQIDPSDATIALAGVYADTGNFIHDDVTEEDFRTASWLISQGAGINLVRKFLHRLSQDHQVTLFHDLLNRLVYHEFQGHFIITSYMEMESQQGGLAAVAEEIHSVENPDATFLVFHFTRENSTLIIARSQKKTLSVNKLLEQFGGGGHRMAASAYLKESSGGSVYRELILTLQTRVLPAICAGDIMSKPVDTINPEWSLMDASIFLETRNHTGAPVTDPSGGLTGLLTLRDIMKGRKAGRMDSRVSGFMVRKTRTITPETSLRDIEELVFRDNLGHLPVLQGERVIGIITRSDLIRFLLEQEKSEETITENELASGTAGVRRKEN